MKRVFGKYDIFLDDEKEQKLEQYYELLLEWNKKINLTAITEYKEVIWKHFIDSALLTKSDLYQEKERKSILDMGTGAGFPGIVLAILSPEKNFTLVDSLQKRIDFLKIVVEKLKLENVKLFHGRAEDYGQKENFRNQFDFVVSRAVAELPLLLEYCIPFVKLEGYFISYKGKKYTYKINLGEYNPIESDYIYQYNKNIDIKKMNIAIKKFERKHNFKSFTKPNPEISDYEREIFETSIVLKDNILSISFIGSGFMRYMVRNIVGCLIEIGENKRNIDDIDRLFKCEDRKEAGIKAEACGLYLEDVFYF